MTNFKFDWDPLLELHIAELDRQHQYFFQLGRHIEQLLLIHCVGVTNEQLMNLLYELRNYVTYHFYTEEKFMEEVGFPELEAHRQQHQRFLKYINSIDYIHLCEHPNEALSQIKSEMVAWSFQHLVQEDHKLSAYAVQEV